MKKPDVVAMLDIEWKFGSDSRKEIEWIGDDAFRVTEIGPDLSVGKCVVGYWRSLDPTRTPLIFKEAPRMSPEQTRVFDSVFRDFSQKIHLAQSQSQREFLLMRNNKHPELFHPLELSPQNIQGSVKEDMIPVWLNLDAMVELAGFKILKYSYASNGERWQLWAHSKHR